MGAWYCWDQQSKLATQQEFNVQQRDKAKGSHPNEADNSKAFINDDKASGENSAHTTGVTVTSFVSPNSELDMETFQELYNKAKGLNGDGKSKLGDTYFYIDWRNKWTLELLNTLAEKYYLPKEIKGVGIGYLDEKWEEVKRFLFKCIQNELEWLWVNYIALDKWEQQYRLGIDEYMSVLEVAIPKVKKWIGINYFKIEDEHYARLVRASHAVEDKIDFDNSALKLESFMDFGDNKSDKITYHTKKISMEDTFIKNKKGKEAAVKILVEAISKSSLKDSLQEIWRSDCNVESDIFEKLIKDLIGSDNIEVS